MLEPPTAKYASHTARLPASPIPDGMKLMQVQVMFRHGDKIDPYRYQNKFPSYLIQDYSRCFRLYPEPREGAPAGQGTESDWEWKHGALTDLGHDRLRHFGGQLRAAFIESEHLLEGAGPRPGDLYLWSRDRPRGRTWCSLQEVISGLWPSLNLSLQDLNVQVGERAGCSVPVCPFPVALSSEAQKIGEEWEAASWPDKESLAVGAIAGALISEARQLGVNGLGIQHPIHHLMMRCAYSLQHGEALPAGFTTEDYCAIARICNKAEIEKFADKRLAADFGHCLTDIADSASRCFGGPGIRKRAIWGDGPAPKLLLYASADLWVGPLATILQAPYSLWPEPGCFLMFEFFCDRDGEAFVRLTRNSEVVGSFLSLPCSEHGLVRWNDVLSKLSPLLRDIETDDTAREADMTTAASS
eukprot:TRINITY_DN38767_c0_g1_i1.p1 TRINITY_DN38767_c0_g1~~TRINITY_DN38767_c0_g1_i1.p1  ORF type:complete len:428 (-),score=32.97 TRINITY_DN38767_c0_g1_i1:49-1290(-)